MFIRRLKENKISKLNSLETKIQEMSDAHIVTFKRLKEENERLARTIKNHIPKEITKRKCGKPTPLGAGWIAI